MDDTSQDFPVIVSPRGQTSLAEIAGKERKQVQITR